MLRLSRGLVSRSCSKPALIHRAYSSDNDQEDPSLKAFPEEYARIGRDWNPEYYDAFYRKHFQYGPLDQDLHRDPDFKEFVTSDTFHRGDESANAIYNQEISPLKFLFGVSVAGFVIYRLHTFLFGDMEHTPLAALTQKLAPTKEEMEDYIRETHTIEKKRMADRALDEWAYWNPETHNRRIPIEVFDVKSEWLVRPGYEVDLTGIKVKHSYQEDDKYFGVPYPQHK